jgi:hypothetical protein
MYEKQLIQDFDISVIAASTAAELLALGTENGDI